MKLLPKIGAVVLIVFAGTLALTGSPQKKTPVSFTDELANIVSAGDELLSPMELADWIYSDLPDVTVVDVRTRRAYMEYAISGSINIPFKTLMTNDGLNQLPKYDRIVLVCDGEIFSAKAWVVLSSKGYDAYILKGGLNAWIDQILTPPEEGTSSLRNSDDLTVAQKVNALREHLLGEGSSTLSEAPTEAVPAPPPVAAPTAPPRKKKVSGGC